MNRDKEQSVPKKAKLSVPSISDINQAQKISSSRIELSVFKKSTTQLQAQDSDSIVKQTLQLPPSSTEQPDANILSLSTSGGSKEFSSSLVRDAASNVVTALQPDSASSSLRPEEGVSMETKDTAAAAPPPRTNPRAMIVNIVQKNNPLMKHVRNVPWELGDIVPDFELGRTVCALFLSVRYHSLHPDYIHRRLKELGKQYQLRILLVYVDTRECHHVLQELAKVALLVDLTLILTWSPEEAARYLETYKAYENKPPDLIMERTDSDFSSRVIDSLTTVKKVNKTDAATLVNNFKTMTQLIKASKEDLTMCPGLGPQKAQRLYDLFHQPFLRTKTDN